MSKLNREIEPESYNISFVIALNVVVFPEPLKPNKPNFSFGSNPKYRLFIALTFGLQHGKNVFVKFVILVENIFCSVLSFSISF